MHASIGHLNIWLSDEGKGLSGLEGLRKACRLMIVVPQG